MVAVAVLVEVEEVGEGRGFWWLLWFWWGLRR